MKATARLDTLTAMLKGAAVSVALATGAADAAPVTVQGLTFDDRISFVLVDDNTSHRFEGRVQGTLLMEGTLRSGAGPRPAAGTWRATRILRVGDEG